jgi:hypothetical protein
VWAGSGDVTTSAPLGRYEDSRDEEDLHEVTLVGLPVRVMLAGREQHDELLRELSLLALGGPAGRIELPKRLAELIEALGVRYGQAAPRPDPELDAAAAAGQDVVDMTFVVPRHAVHAADTLERLMSTADEFCRSEHLLTTPRSDVQVRFARWYLEEFRRQISGLPPQPWTGELDDL